MLLGYNTETTYDLGTILVLRSMASGPQEKLLSLTLLVLVMLVAAGTEQPLELRECNLVASVSEDRSEVRGRSAGCGERPRCSSSMSCVGCGKGSAWLLASTSSVCSL